MSIDKELPRKLAPAESAAEIMQLWDRVNEPVVSICCATFNHADFFEDAIGSFLAQVTTFPFEIVIRDDGSTDGTTAIVRDYASRYPNIVRAVVETENQFSKGVRPLHAWPSLAKGEFVALCEGDDFWIDPFKLQKQIDLLRKHPEAVMSVARTALCQQDGDALRFLQTTSEARDELLGFEEIHHSYFHTSTYLIRTGIFKDVINVYFSGHALFGDTALRAIMITRGKFAYLQDVVSVYRITGTGIWTSLGSEKQLQWELDGSLKLAAMLNGIHRTHQQGKIFGLALSLLKFYFKNKSIAKGIGISPLVFWYGMMKLPRFVFRKVKLN